MAGRLASRMGMGRPAMGLGSALGLGLWVRTCLALLVEPVGFPPLRVGLTRVSLRLSAG
jgi:hypothetical protein